MGLAAAHEGYEYQDLLTVYFILNEILHERNAEFTIDRKEYKGDIIDDLLIVNKNKKFKKQIKYSNEDYNHVLCKADFSSDGNYNLSLDSLYHSWNNNTNKDSTDFRICLSWKEPADELASILVEVEGIKTFPNYPSKVFKINGEKFWPEDSLPLASWRRFRRECKQIDRLSFLKFCECLKIEVLMPKISLNLKEPGELEKIVIDQAKDLGIGVFPNTHLQPETFLLSLLAVVKRSRSKSNTIVTSSILHELDIRTDYGSIEQYFPVAASENIKRLPLMERFINDIDVCSKVILSGEPGSGKSWFIDNLMNHLKSKNIAVIRHLCYTDLNDGLQRERIKLNVFYGNLISDILDYYPNLRKVKKHKFASNLSELNHLLTNIHSPVFIIIDGLDHIERIANFRGFNDITFQDRAIIESLESLVMNPNIKIVVSSQNIPQLGLLPSFVKKTVPLWTEHDVKCYLKKNKVPNKLLIKGLSTAAFLVQKSNGNPLYLKYLVDAIKEHHNVTFNTLDALPSYSYNLSDYYSYLLSQLKLREEVPQVLSAVSFSLTKQELEEITQSGDFVEESLQILSPVLKTNISLSGYSIYHESFRRFIIDYLKSKSVSIEQKIFRPVTEWFESKNFFAYQKSYRYYLPFLNDGGSYEKILSLLDHKFVTDSIMAGKSWQLIEKNYNIFVNAACCTNNFPYVILLNEINKIISSCKDQFEEIHPIYLEAIGNIHGYEYLSSYLAYENSRTVTYRQGLMACYLCDQNNITAPWELYMEYFKKGKKVTPDNFKYLIRGLLVLKDEKRLIRIGKAVSKNAEQYFLDFKNELKIYHDQYYAESIRAKFSAINDFHAEELFGGPTYTHTEILLMAESILAMDNVFDKEVDEIKKFFTAVKGQVEDEELLSKVIDLFKSKNWFYNWLIFFLKIIKISSKSTFNYDEVREAFKYLTLRLKPFEGQPRTCDLYGLQPFIYQSFREGLKFVFTNGQWNEIIDILVLVCNSTTTSLQRSMSGPLTADKLFELLAENATEENYTLIVTALEKQLTAKSEYYLHTDIAGFNLKLATIHALFNNQDTALSCLTKGIEFSLAYTMRKDLTLMDMINGIEIYHINNPEKSMDALRTTKILIDSAIAHTDGRETDYFPNLWFEKFLNIDFHKASLYLLNELKSYTYSWSDEKSLVELLCKANGKIHPEIEACIALTFPLEDSEKFIFYSIELYEKLLKINPSISKKLEDRIIAAMKPANNRQRSNELVKRYNTIITDSSLKAALETNKDTSLNSCNPKPVTFAAGKSFSEMSAEEIFFHFEKYSIQEEDLKSFGILLKNNKEFTDEIKEIIKLIVLKNNKSLYEKINLDAVFCTGGSSECYYWVCRFVFDSGGWFQKLVNTEAFIKAHVISPESSFNFLFELLPQHLNDGSNISFSSNILKLLTALGYDPSKTEECWQNMVKVTAGRFPVQNEIEWETIFTDDMNSTEVLFSILLSRFKAGSSDRYKLVVMALEINFFKEPDNWIKPFNWFLKNKEEFSNAALIILLQYIFKKSLQNINYGLKFKEDLSKIYPSKYFAIDYITAKLFGYNISSIYHPQGLIYPTVPDEMLRFLYNMNYRFQIFDMNEVNVESCFDKYAATFPSKFKDRLDIYHNRLYKRMLRHIHGSEYMMDIINTDCYEELSAWELWDEPEYFQLGTFIDTDSMALYSNSWTLRPADLLKPSEIIEECCEIVTLDEGWIRLGHIETELQESGTFDISSYRSFGGIVFSKTCKNGLPYLNHQIYPFDIWRDRKLNLPLDNHVVSIIIQEDPLEFFKILWLHPKIVEILKLTVIKNSEGLQAVDSDGKKALYIRTWSCNYLGTGHNSRFSDQIPALEGTDLLIRKDYFDKISALFENNPNYFTKASSGHFV